MRTLNRAAILEEIEQNKIDEHISSVKQNIRKQTSNILNNLSNASVNSPGLYSNRFDPKKYQATPVRLEGLGGMANPVRKPS